MKKFSCYSWVLAMSGAVFVFSISQAVHAVTVFDDPFDSPPGVLGDIIDSSGMGWSNHENPDNEFIAGGFHQIKDITGGPDSWVNRPLGDLGLAGSYKVTVEWGETTFADNFTQLDIRFNGPGGANTFQWKAGNYGANVNGDNRVEFNPFGPGGQFDNAGEIPNEDMTSGMLMASWDDVAAQWSVTWELNFTGGGTANNGGNAVVFGAPNLSEIDNLEIHYQRNSPSSTEGIVNLDRVTIELIPEPSALLLALLGTVTLGCCRRSRSAI